ncbi:MAG: PTS sugar transporter subunit IIA [Candidatus Eisenbacteria bacterium]|uniref:PTS sugar transporter subunit IIA n=1 Tax=Eiseniibacteriota bacterium TaxID=2212470 RepID=A0A956M1R1_UNCEI|nr:PTS sugar transporter subunit IIA [Candidatus Eisenbacteria bacterium]
MRKPVGWTDLGRSQAGSWRILHYFDPNLFVPNLESTTKDEALRELTDRLAQGAGVRDPELLLDMLRRRESLGSTGIGKGVAIPHGRSLAITDLRVLFARSEAGVEFDAMDEKPVHLFFLIVAPPQDKRNEYLPLLGRIAELVKEKRVRDKLRKVEQFDDLRELLEEQIRGE